MNLIDWINGTTKLNKTTMEAFQNNIQAGILSVFPMGGVIEYYLEELPNDEWLWCDGSAISRTDYAKLFEKMGTKYGAGDGETTFNLPDHSERVAVGYKAGSQNGTAGATLETLGAKGGEFKHTMTSSELVAHEHQGIQVNNPQATAWSYIGNEKATAGGWNTSTANGHVGTYQYANYNGFSGNFTASNSKTGSTGSSQAFNIMQPYIVCNYIIKVK